MVFRAAAAVNDLRPLVTARSRGERVIDSVHVPERRSAMRSTEESAHLAMRLRCIPGAVNVCADSKGMTDLCNGRHVPGSIVTAV
jgi:hypothetical protein